ncbi:hypothetical protein P3S67_019180 [Capsicum chacoense]
MANIIITTRFHHGGKFVSDEEYGPRYIGESEVKYVSMDKAHFSIFELLYYTKEFGYMTVGGFYFKDPKKKVFIEVENDLTSVSLVEDLEDGDFLDLYVNHVVDEVEVVEDRVPSSFLCGTVGDQSSNVIGENSNVGENISTVHDINVEGLHEELTQTDNIDIESGADELSDLEGAETDLDSSADSQEFNIPEDDDSEVDEELRTFRNERRNCVKQKKPVQNEEIKLGSADSSEVDSDDSADGLEPEAVRGVDLLARRKSKKVRFDPDCVVAIFELGMIFENAKQFRKVVAEYAVEYKVRLKLKPNEKHRVRVRCEEKKCKWLLFASIDKHSGDFVVKHYYPVHVCTTTIKNKLCTSKFIASKFKDEITLQSYIKLWEIQKLVRKKLSLYVGKIVCSRAKHRIIKEFLGDWKMEFSRLCDYADMIKHTNPDSSCWVRIDRESQLGKNLFAYFYLYFDALKRGWLVGCRKIIGLDGCFLKGSCKGELLVAVGRSENNHMYPITWVVVYQEKKHSWSFFINHLIQDLNLDTGHGLTVMSHMQKGLVPIILELLPDYEMRWCARHIWSN